VLNKLSGLLEVDCQDIKMKQLSHPQLIQQIAKHLSSTFSMKQLGHLDYILRIEIKHLLYKSLLMTQSSYLAIAYTGQYG